MGITKTLKTPEAPLSARGLPFNIDLLGADFIPVKPGDQPWGPPGSWALLQGRSLVVLDDPRGATLPRGELPSWCAAAEEPVCIGLWQGDFLWALAIAADTDIPAPFITLPFQGTETPLDDRLSTLAGLANQILHWQRRSRFCSCCSVELARIPGTWGMRCPACGAEHFPHIHPCIIVLVRRGEELLLVRHAGRGNGNYSLIAGFLDFGESLEECVQREVREEAGVEVTNIRYVGNQSWPFPSQQMVGFLADYAGGEVRPDGVEVTDASWFTFDTLPRHPGSLRSIARWILNSYGSG